MGVYQYTIKTTRDNAIFGTVGVLEFHYKWSMDLSERREQEARYHKTLQKWAGKELPTVVVWNGGFYVWNTNLPTWCDADEHKAPLQLSEGWDRLEQAGLTDNIPSWLSFAIGDQAEGRIPYTPTTKRNYEKLSSAMLERLTRVGGHE